MFAYDPKDFSTRVQFFAGFVDQTKSSKIVKCLGQGVYRTWKPLSIELALNLKLNLENLEKP